MISYSGKFKAETIKKMADNNDNILGFGKQLCKPYPTRIIKLINAIL